MSVIEQPLLKFKGVEIIDTYFNSKQRFDSNVKSSINTSVKPKVFIPEEDDKVFSIIIEAELSVVDYFALKVAAVGSFEITGDINDDIRNSFINVNAPAIMFPYIRSFISTFTSNLGGSISTVTIPPHLFSGTLETYEGEEE